MVANIKNIDVYDESYCIICGRKSSNGDLEQSGRYTELQDAINKRKEVETLEISEPKTGCSNFRARPHIFGLQKTACQICSSAKQEKAPKPTVSTFWELVMFHMCFRRLFRNELCTKNAGGPEMLKTNLGREFEAPKLLGIARYFDRHKNLYTQTYGE